MPAAGSTDKTKQAAKLPLAQNPPLLLPAFSSPPATPVSAAAAESITKTKQAVELLKKVGAYADVEKAKVRSSCTSTANK